MSALSHTTWYCLGSALARLAAVFTGDSAPEPNLAGLFRALEPEWPLVASRSLLPAAGMMTTKLCELTLIRGGGGGAAAGDGSWLMSELKCLLEENKVVDCEVKCAL